MYECPRLCVQVQKGPRPTSLASDSQACAMILSIDSSTSGASDQADARKVNNRQPRKYKYNPDALVLLIERLRGKDHIKKMKQYHIKRMKRPWPKNYLAGEELFRPWPKGYTHIHTDIRTLDAATAAATVATAATAATAVAATTAVTAMMIFMMVMTVMTVMIW